MFIRVISEYDSGVFKTFRNINQLNEMNSVAKPRHQESISAS